MHLNFGTGVRLLVGLMLDNPNPIQVQSKSCPKFIQLISINMTCSLITQKLMKTYVGDASKMLCVLCFHFQAAFDVV